MRPETAISPLATAILRAFYGERDCPPTLASLQQITPTELEALYGVGYRLLTNGKAHEAAAVFHFLCLLDHANVRYHQAFDIAERTVAKAVLP